MDYAAQMLKKLLSVLVSALLIGTTVVVITAAPAAAEPKLKSGVCGTYEANTSQDGAACNNANDPSPNPIPPQHEHPTPAPDFVPTVLQAVICFVVVKYIMRKVPGTDGVERWVRTQLLRTVCKARPA
ncbi:hypothetical protein [Candidatus Poriferisodalis sp.]|uniref:hypothetical protein n=1 Tax=Candidatus Poriferisodalis sp. TaxID=3101277 RepID=UPI003B015B42